jgi:hypothetical protein
VDSAISRLTYPETFHQIQHYTIAAVALGGWGLTQPSISSATKHSIGKGILSFRNNNAIVIIMPLPKNIRTFCAFLTTDEPPLYYLSNILAEAIGDQQPAAKLYNDLLGSLLRGCVFRQPDKK